MELRGKHILIISPEGWRGLHMSKHHVAQGLVDRGARVSFWGADWGRHEHIAPPESRGVREVFARHWLKGVNRMPRWVNTWYYGRIIRALEKQAGAPFDIVWCFDTSRLQWFPKGPWFKLLHLVDWDILHSGHGLMRTADLIVTTADVINARVRELAPGANVHKVGHALDPIWLKDTAGLDAPRTGPPKVVVYAGQFFNTYIDFEALVRIAERHPELEFKYVGTYAPDFPDPWFQRLRTEIPNVRFTGLVSKSDLLPIVRSADLLLFCFMTDKYSPERANPHKVLEYLSTGNVIVGSYTMEYEAHGGLLVMSRWEREYADRFDEAVRKFAGLNTRERRAERIAFASERTIPHLLDHVEQLIQRAMPQ